SSLILGAIAFLLSVQLVGQNVHLSPFRRLDGLTSQPLCYYIWGLMSIARQDKLASAGGSGFTFSVALVVRFVILVTRAGRVYPKIVGGTVIARSAATKQSRLAKSGDCFAPSGRSQ
ncbi:MAG: hypothetical protein OEW09_14415, partial [Anaerolineae bacterium]|nr:hypothetical protein [Anaerolineae bacterium]